MGNLFKEFADSIGADVDMNQMYGTLYNKALEGDADCGGILSYGNYAGEPITNVEKGRPMVVRTPETKFTLANFMRSHLYTALGVIKVGMDILTKRRRCRDRYCSRSWRTLQDKRCRTEGSG